MGTCQSDMPNYQDSNAKSEDEHIETEQMQYVVLASWKHDESEGTNQPNQIIFGKQNQDYYQGHNQFLQNQNQIQFSRVQQVSVYNNISKISNITSQPLNQIQQKQRISAFSGYSQADRTAGLIQDQDIQKRPINLARRNIF